MKYGELDYSKMGWIYPKYKVAVTEETVNAGYSHDSERVRELLKLDTPYEVAKFDVGRSSSTIYLKEFPTISFNSVNFKQVINNDKSSI